MGTSTSDNTLTPAEPATPPPRPVQYPQKSGTNNVDYWYQILLSASYLRIQAEQDHETWMILWLGSRRCHQTFQYARLNTEEHSMFEVSADKN